MYSTFKLMYSCTNKAFLEQELEDLCACYKQEENNKKQLLNRELQLQDSKDIAAEAELEIIDKKLSMINNKQNKIIAAMFCKVYPMILTIQKKYYSLTNEQKVEHALFHLVRCTKYYKNDGKVKFSSFFQTHMQNQMKTLLTSENSLKKAVFQNIVRDNENVLTWYGKNAPTKSLEMTEKYFLDNLKTSCHLSAEEKEYCACIIAGYDKVQNISDKLNLKNRYGISDPIRSMNIQDLAKQQDLDTKREQRRIRKIKQSIKEKIDKYGREIFY